MKNLVDTKVLTAALALAALAAAGGLAAALRRRSRREPSPTGAARSASPDDSVASVVEREWRCVCGQRYRVSGEGRHRVYWRTEAQLNEPVIDGRCSNCERPLPREHAV